MVHVEPTCFGPPTYTQVCARTPQHVIQAGRIVGLLGYPVTPGPIFPAYEHFDRRVLVAETPTKYGYLWLDYPLSYQYHFTLPVAASAYPTNF
jgi:hypothetical protein